MPFHFLAYGELTLFQPGGKIIPTTTLPAPPDFWLVWRLCVVILFLSTIVLLYMYLLLRKCGPTFSKYRVYQLISNTFKKVDYYAKLRTTIFRNILVAYLSLLIPFLSYQNYVYKTTDNVNELVVSL